MYAHLLILLLQLLELLLRGDQLTVHQVHLLGRHLFFDLRGRLARGWRLSTNIVQGVLVVRLELGMLELPCLDGVSKARGQSRCLRAYTWPIGRMSCFLVVVADLVKVILVQLAHEAGKVAVLEMLGKDVFGESFVLLPVRVCPSLVG